MLSTNTNTPPVTKTTMGSNFLETFNIITKFGIHTLRKDLRVLSRFEILLTIQKPKWNFELTRILNNGHELFNFIRRQFSGTLIDIDFGLFAN